MRRLHPIVWVVPALAVGIGIGSFRSSEVRQETPLEPVLERVQALGELRAARFHYQTVFEHETSRHPEDWTRMIPGAASLVQASTRNTALVSARASVDAGVDLRQAKVAREDGRLVVTLPPVRVFQPLVRARVHDVNRGWLWRDDNIGLTASERAGAQIRVNALRQGIVREAEKNAIERVQALVGPDAEVRFAR